MDPQHKIESVDEDQPRSQLALNVLLLLAVPIPSLVAWWRGDLLGLHPIAAVNLLMLLNVTVLFWLISLWQKNAWLMDIYWTIIPLFVGHFYASHPGAASDPWRARVALACLWLWSIRLTHNYLRREGYAIGAREDWRFAKKRAESRHFWWYSFFYAFVSQHVMLAGLTLPLWALAVSTHPVGWLDGVLAATALSGIAIAYFADTQLEAFMRVNRERRARGEEPVLILERGLWRYSRHPNYFGEQLFWMSIAGWGVMSGHAWTAIGSILNGATLITVTAMTEARMSSRPERREAWDAYKRRTSAWVPWPPRQMRS